MFESTTVHALPVYNNMMQSLRSLESAFTDTQMSKLKNRKQITIDSFFLK